MNEIELELDRQTLRPGEVLSGTVLSHGGPSEHLTLSLQGEEILSADSIAYNYVLPIVEQKIEVRPDSQGTPFSFTLPDHAPPTYASSDLKCQYFLKLRRPGGLLGRETIQKFHLSVLGPPAPEEAAPRCVSLKDPNVTVEVQLDRTNLYTGDSLTGELYIDRTNASAQLPKLLSFRLAAIEESVERGYNHRKVVWLATHDVVPDPADLELPLRGVFEFPIPEDAPFCGEWATFRVHYGFRISVDFADGNNVRESAPVQVYRRYLRLD